MNNSSFLSEHAHSATCCSSSSSTSSSSSSSSLSPPMQMLTTEDYLDGLHCVHEAQKVHATPQEIIYKLRLYLEDKVGGTTIVNTILNLIRTKQIIDFNNHKEFEYCTSLLPLFMILVCLENSLVKQR